MGQPDRGLIVENGKGPDGLKSGRMPSWGKCDPDQFRAWVQENKPLLKTDKRTTMADAVARHVADGSYVKLGGFGQVRTSMSAIHEIVRQRKRGLVVAGHTTSHDLDVLLSGGCVAKIEVAYSFGHEFRPQRSATGPRLIREGKLEVSEWSNASFAWRLKAAAMGLSFIPARFMLATDTFNYSGAKEVACPFTNKTYCALPALYPDVAIIHVNRCDRYGNAFIKGMVIADDDAAMASRRVIVSAEEIVDEEYFLSDPDRTVIPYYCVDAVVASPMGSYPCEMPGLYWFDEGFIAAYIKSTHDPAALAAHLDRFYYGTSGWEDHLRKAAGAEKLEQLRKIARHEAEPPRAGDIWND
jgi:acyl CoA:acetate/3-ketoacid CoA transferase alpha subunit